MFSFYQTVDGYTGKLTEAWPAIALSCAGFFAVWIPVTLALRRCSSDARRHGYGDDGSFEITSMIHCTVVLYRATVVISGMSCSLRFPGQLNCDLRKIVAGLALYGNGQ